MDKEVLGNRLKEAIRHAGLSQTEAQEQLVKADVRGASHANFYKILKGETLPSAELLAEASQLLGVSADWLLTGEGQMARSKPPMTEEEAEYYGLQDLPAPIQGDVEELVLRFYRRMDRTGLTIQDTEPRLRALIRGLAAWLRIPLHSEKTRTLESEVERTAYCDTALRALRMLIPEEGSELRSADIDKVFVKLARVERELADRSKPSEPETEEP